LDVLVENRLPLELKSVESVLPIHHAQVLTYLRLGSFPLGLLINFDVAVLKQGLTRFAATKPRISAAQTPPVGLDSSSGELIAAAVEVHRELGPGLLRSTYEECLSQELRARGIPFTREKKVPLSFAGHQLGYSADMPLVVWDQIPVFCLSVATVAPVHESRLLARLRQAHLSRGFLLNFNAPTLAQGLRRLSLS
jgi:GxxExxY protein